MPADIHDRRLAATGRARIEWAGRDMPVLRAIEARFRRTQALKGLRIGACLHVTTETANLVLALKAGGAKVALCASNPLSTQDDVAASLVAHHRLPVFAVHGEDKRRYYRHIRHVLAIRPHITVDDGADLVSMIHRELPALGRTVWGGTEETTTGVIRLKSLERLGKLLYPIIAVNDAKTKHMFDNRYGTGQSTIDGILRATNRLLAGMRVVVAGYGWCGRGIALRARGMGANVMVTEVDPIRALEATMDGFAVEPMSRACRFGEIFVTATGNLGVIRREHLVHMRDGAILCNAGHFNVEVDLVALQRLAKKRGELQPGVDEFVLPGGRRIIVLGEGRLVNLTMAKGHPASVMDMSFANQALAIEHLARHHARLERRVYPVSEAIDHRIAQLKLRALGIGIDRLTAPQRAYLADWAQGT